MPRVLGAHVAAHVLLLAVAASSAGARAEDARVLPVGRSRASFVYGQSAGISETYNSNGVAESLTAPYNVDLSKKVIGSFHPKMNELIQFLNGSGYRYDLSQRSTANHGIIASDDPQYPLLGDALTRGFLGTDGGGKRTQMAFTYFRGITDKLSLGITAPYIVNKLRIDPSLTGVNTANDIYYGFAQGSGMTGDIAAALDFLRTADLETLQNHIVSQGYHRVESFEKGGMGDVVLGGRYNYLNQTRGSGDWLASGQLSIGVPTGKSQDPADLIGIYFGEGAWELGLAHIVNFTPKSLKQLSLSNGLHFNYRVPNRREMRVRNTPGELFPDPSTQEPVLQHLGEKIWITGGAKWAFNRTISFDSSYELYWKTLTTYRGSRPKDYSYLSQGTDSYLETLQVGLNFNSVSSFLRSDFPIPGELSFNYYLPMRGRNTLVAAFGMAELALFF